MKNANGLPRLVVSYGLLLLLCSAVLPPKLLARKSRSEAAKNTAQPELRIPVGSLGYMPPGALPAFYYHALVGVHFIDETHLLFTFGIKGLLQRDDKCPATDTQRMVRAVVLDVPSGKVEKQADWELYDFRDYLWGLGNGQFLLRRCSRFDLVGAALDPHPFIDAAGAIQAISYSPDRSVVVLEEASKAAGKTSQGAVLSQSSGSSHGHDTGEAPAERVDVQFIRLHPLSIIAQAQIPLAGVIPVFADGILEALEGAHNQWTVNQQPFSGPERKIGSMRSFCMPALTPVSKDVFVAMMCPKSDEMAYHAYNLQGGLLWQMPVVTDRWLPRFILTRNGAHFAIETLQLKHPRATLDPITKDDVEAEVIDIYDTHTGVRVGSFRTMPVYTAGKNVDFSPDGTRIAVLHNGAIEIYTLSELAKHRQ